MKRININILSSEKSNLTHFVFRGNTTEEVPSDLSILSTKEPVLTVDESVAEHSALLLTENIEPNASKIPRNGKTPYKFNYTPLGSTIHNIVIHAMNHTSEGTIKSTLVLEMDNNKNILNIVQYVNGVEIEPTFAPHNFELIGNTIYLPDEICSKNFSHEAIYYVKVVDVLDDSSKQTPGVEHSGNTAHGLNEPGIDQALSLVQVATNTTLPIINLTPIISESAVDYYYRIVSKDATGNVSDPSPLFSALLNQQVENIRFNLLVSENYDPATPSGAVWKLIENNIKHTDTISVGNPTSDNFNIYGAPVSKTVPVFNKDLLYMIDTDYETHNVIKYYIKNPWYKADEYFNKRLLKAFKYQAVDGDGEIQDSKLIAGLSKVNVHIDKVVVLKKDVTELVEKDIALSENDPAVTNIKTWIKREGIYYIHEEHKDLTLNEFIVDETISLMDLSSNVPNIGIIDNSFNINRDYNITVYLYDAYGNKSSAITQVFRIDGIQ